MIIVLGDGLLASELIGQTGWPYLSRKQDFLNFNSLGSVISLIPDDCTTLVNCIAYTDTYSNDKSKMLQTNYHSLANLVEYCNHQEIKLVHYSTDYVYAGSNPNASEEDIPIPDKTWYAYSKLLADEYIIRHSDNYLIVRGSHRINPFPYATAWNDQIGNFDDVDILVDQWIKLIKAEQKGVWNIGTPVKSVYEYASREIDVDSAPAPDHFPKDTTMDLTKLNTFLETLSKKEV
jgi:dTDP-4-dehydrorhamnose reductase